MAMQGDGHATSHRLPLVLPTEGLKTYKVELRSELDIYSATSVKDEACLLSETAPHVRMHSNTFGSFSIKYEASFLKFANPVISPLTVDMMSPRLSWNCGCNKHMFAAKECLHIILQVQFLNMFQELHRPPKIKFTKIERFLGIVMFDSHWAITSD